MENANQFRLEVAVDSYFQVLQEKGNYTSEDILELKSHLIDNVIELKKKGLDDDEAFIIAKKRLGKEEELRLEYKKVNGNKFYNRELFILVLSISSYLLAYYFYTLITDTIKQYAIFENKNLTAWGTINYLFNIFFTIGILYLVFNCKKYIRVFERFFIKSPVNFSLILITLITIVYVFHLRGGKMFFKTNFLSPEEFQNRYDIFQIDNTLRAYIYSALTCVWIVSILIAFIKSYKKVNFLDNIINDSGYIPLFLIGLFWDGVAASSRMLTGVWHNDHFFISNTIFGMIWLIGMLIFNIHLSKNILARNLIFISFGFLLELGAGIWINPSLNAGMPISVYFIALVVGSTAGFAIANFIKSRNIKIAV